MCRNVMSQPLQRDRHRQSHGLVTVEHPGTKSPQIRTRGWSRAAASKPQDAKAWLGTVKWAGIWLEMLDWEERRLHRVWGLAPHLRWRSRVERGGRPREKAARVGAAVSGLEVPGLVWLPAVETPSPLGSCHRRGRCDWRHRADAVCFGARKRGQQACPARLGPPIG